VGRGWARNRKWLDKILSSFIWNLDFCQTLEICTGRFRRNFDIGILPKILYASQGFLENEICHAVLCNLRSKFNLEKILPHMIYKKNMQPNALLIWQQKYL
jgi:hypothetical protein